MLRVVPVPYWLKRAATSCLARASQLCVCHAAQLGGLSRHSMAAGGGLYPVLELRTFFFCLEYSGGSKPLLGSSTLSPWKDQEDHSREESPDPPHRTHPDARPEHAPHNKYAPAHARSCLCWACPPTGTNSQNVKKK